MSYILFDLEFNQSFSDEQLNIEIKKKCPFEIIQIGAYKLDDDLNVLSTFNRFVKPTLYPKIHPFIKELTNISQEQLDFSQDFKLVFQEFLSFIGTQEEAIFCVWGMGDIKELYRNIYYHQLQDDFTLKQYINVQNYVSKHFHLPGGKSIGLKNAIDFLDILLSKPLHDAIHDAYYTVEIFRKLKINQVQPKKYYPEHLNNNSSRNEPRKVIDYEALIHQFEKMNNKILSEEEKSMIILAYKMGMTHQFQTIHDIKESSNDLE